MPREPYRTWGDEKPRAFTWMVPLDVKDMMDARAKAISKLDTHDLTRTSENEDYQIRHAIIYEFKENVVGMYTNNKALRQAAIEKKRKEEELKRAEAEVARLKKELGEG